MKKVILIILICFAQVTSKSQSMETIGNLILAQNFVKAKDSIDAYMTVPANTSKSIAWYCKGLIYNEISKNEAENKNCTNCKMQAFNAFVKYYELDKDGKLMMEEQNVRLFDIYNNYFDEASKLYESKMYGKALETFKNAEIVQTYIAKKGFSYNGYKFGNIDTMLCVNAALVARLSKNSDAAAFYYRKLLDINLYGKDYLEGYQFLANYYAETKKMTALDEMLKKMYVHYPNVDLWTELAIEKIDNNDKPLLFKKYEELIAIYPTKYTLWYNYAVELFNYTYIGDRKNDYIEMQNKLEDICKKTMQISNKGNVNLLLARHFYNKVYDLAAAAKTDIAIKTKMKATADECIFFAEKTETIYAASTSLSASDKADYKNALTILQAMYTYKKENEKAEKVKLKMESL
jgi:hypothetical protein